jgi:predicted amidohydrolase YtcJ
MILENGVVRTLDPSLPTARALAVAREQIAGGVGTHETALASPEVVDLGGRCVLPGFADAHVHFAAWAIAQNELRLEHARSLDDVLELVAGAVREVPKDGWLRGTGWRDAGWSVPPTKEALDRAAGRTPALLVAKDGHTVWVNSAALALSDRKGDGSGVLRERDAWHFLEQHGRAGDDETVSAMRAALETAAARGVTSVHDVELAGSDSLRLWQLLRARTQVTLRVWQLVPHERLEELTALGLRSGFGDDLLRIGHLKVFMDGTLGSRTAHMLDGSGIELTSRGELEEIVRRGAEAGFPVAVHAIGDAANRDALDALESTREHWAPRGLRSRIEHAQCVTGSDRPRFAGLGVAASVQLSHATSDRDLVERLWAERLESAYPFRSLADSGATLANGSDAPVEELDPWAGVCAGVLRTADKRTAWRPEEALTLEQALLATCVAPAWLTGDERRRGRLLPGYLADLVVLDRDPFAVDPAELPELEVVATMLGGRWVFNPPPWD